LEGKKGEVLSGGRHCAQKKRVQKKSPDINDVVDIDIHPYREARSHKLRSEP
jgi:hypothetical protein